MYNQFDYENVQKPVSLTTLHLSISQKNIQQNRKLKQCEYLKEVYIKTLPSFSI